MGFLDKMKEQAKQKIAELQKQFTVQQDQTMPEGENQQGFEHRQSLQPETNNTPPPYVPASNQTIVEPPLVPNELDVTPPLPPSQPEAYSSNASQQNGTGGGIYGDYMEHLIEMALADGELTEKEKQVLFKKASANGIDLDEFEMVLDARLYERQKAMQAAQPIAHDSAPNSDKYGDVRKCPACGAIVESFTIKCADCGYEFRNVTSVSSVQILHKKIEALEEKRKIDVVKEAFGFVNNVDRQITTLIQMFPVPVTKEDILEFLALSASLAKKPSWRDNLTNLQGNNHNMVANAWWQKCNQVIIKARIAMKDDKKSLEEIEAYAKALDINPKWRPK